MSSPYRLLMIASLLALSQPVAASNPPAADPGFAWSGRLLDGHAATDERPPTRGSSDDCLTGLTASLTTVLDADPDLQGYCFGEDVVNGWLAASYEPIELRYNSFGSDGLPCSTNIFVGSTPIGTINFPPGYLGSNLAMIFRGDTYCTSISEQDIVFTPVPEPSAVGLTIGGAALGFCRGRRPFRSVWRRRRDGVCAAA